MYSKPPHLANLSLAKFLFGGRVATNHRVHAWRFEFKIGSPLGLHGEPCSSPVTSDLSLNLSERSVRVPFSHFVCTTLCSASVGTNSGDLSPKWPLPAQQVVPVGVRTMVVASHEFRWFF
ncbi:hypothetical protein E2C01_085540 [Portunus trituberculatus]|uniref:Uncharacterized protein n=1 Tax=Portunus trituberculatus TaxID=210409 RepID=A0A5B7JC73_PORTR|nr:hypothetical protein [Portunus trituberculatus]